MFLQLFESVTLVISQCYLRYTSWSKRPCSHTARKTRRGGGGALDSHLDGGGGENLTLSQTARRTKIHPVTIYLTKNFHMHTLYWYGRTVYSAVYHHTFIQICCVPYAPSLVLRSRACHKHCGLGSNPVINGVVRQ